LAGTRVVEYLRMGRNTSEFGGFSDFFSQILGVLCINSFDFSGGGVGEK
jgi:hypothetical protein